MLQQRRSVELTSGIPLHQFGLLLIAIVQKTARSLATAISDLPDVLPSVVQSSCLTYKTIPRDPSVPCDHTLNKLSVITQFADNEPGSMETG